MKILGEKKIQAMNSLNCVRLAWGWLGVVLWLSCGFDNFLANNVSVRLDSREILRCK